MKKYYILFTLILAFGYSNAQTFSFTPNNIVHKELDWDKFSDLDMSFTTIPLRAVQYKWELISNTMPADWMYSLCDYTSCYTGIPANGTMTPISSSAANSGTTGFFKITVYPGTFPDSAMVKIYVHDILDVNIGDTVIFTMNMKNQLSTSEESVLNFTVYPNPVKDKLIIKNIAKAGQIQVYTITGEMVRDISTSGSSDQEIDVSSLEPGVYLVAFEDLDGIRHTKKVTIQ